MYNHSIIQSKHCMLNQYQNQNEVDLLRPMIGFDVTLSARRQPLYSRGSLSFPR